MISLLLLQPYLNQAPCFPLYCLQFDKPCNFVYHTNKPFQRLGRFLADKYLLLQQRKAALCPLLEMV